jgi:acyl-coenzyme A synthetase/AMP-(fatty) acid ligase
VSGETAALATAGRRVWRDSLPRNANGKILKRELRAELAAREY